MATAAALLSERRIATRMLARGEQGLAEALLQLKGVVFGGRFRFECLIAVGGEGAVFLVTDLEAPGRPHLVGKVPLHPVHRPFDLTADDVRARRRGMRLEAVLLETNGSPWMPSAVGSFQFGNPSLPRRRGGAFAEAEPVLVMERLPGIDLDRWLARAHSRGLSAEIVGDLFDRIAADLLGAVADLRARGFHYADLRPGNLRLLRRPDRHIRLLDAGSLVPVEGDGRFPHVPAYLPPDVFATSSSGQPILPDDRTIAVMAGRTLFEIVTGDRTFPGEATDLAKLVDAPASPAVREVVAGLCSGEFADVASSARALEERGGLTARIPAPLPKPPRVAARPAAAEAESGISFVDEDDGPPTPRAARSSRTAAMAAASKRATPAPAAPAAGGWEAASFLADDVEGLPAAASHVAAPPEPWWRRLLAALRILRR